MYLHKERKRMTVSPGPDYSGMSIRQRIDAKCREAKARIDSAEVPVDGTARHQVEEVLSRERVEAGGWTRLGLYGSAG